jgi:hypothetical protein
MSVGIVLFAYHDDPLCPCSIVSVGNLVVAYRWQSFRADLGLLLEGLHNQVLSLDLNAAVSDVIILSRVDAGCR